MYFATKTVWRCLMIQSFIVLSFYLEPTIWKNMSMLYLTQCIIEFFYASSFAPFDHHRLSHIFIHTMIHTGIPSHLIVIGWLEYDGFTICFNVWSCHVLLLNNNSKIEPNAVHCFDFKKTIELYPQ